MARPLRIEYEGALYHVTARGNERKKVFFSKKDYEKFLDYVADAQEKYHFILHAFVLMENHFHLILETPEANLSQIMHYVNGSYTTYVNIKRNRSGHLFQGRFKAIIVEKDNYLLELSRYVHLNPVRAKMTKKPEEYEHSSYRSYILSEQKSIVSTETILGMITKEKRMNKERYRDFVESALADETESPLSHVYGGMILGSEKFVQDMLGRLEDCQVETEEVSNRKALRRGIETEGLLDAVSAHFNVDAEEILKNKRSVARKAFIYLVKKYCGIPNREIGDLLDYRSISASTKMSQAFERQMETDPELREQVLELQSKFSTFKG